MLGSNTFLPTHGIYLASMGGFLCRRGRFLLPLLLHESTHCGLEQWCMRTVPYCPFVLSVRVASCATVVGNDGGGDGDGGAMLLAARVRISVPILSYVSSYGARRPLCCVGGD